MTGRSVYSAIELMAVALAAGKPNQTK